jgi:hypothetical protein
VVKKLSIEGSKKKPMLNGKNKDGTRNTKLDFSAANNRPITTAWFIAINKKDDIFSVIYKRALACSGIMVQSDNMGSTNKLVNDRADIDSESE